jgi:SAM-dependent methyltransferase
VLAESYDRGALHSSAPGFAEQIASLIEPGESVLEIGPGTGGFTVPVARRAGRVLAIEFSDAMLRALADRLDVHGIGNVQAREGEWPDVDVPAHDAVLAVNSLYRVVEIRTCIERMTACARRRVIVAWSIGHNPPMLPSLVDPGGPRRYQPGVTYIHLVLALHELGIAYDLAVQRAPRIVRRASIDDAAVGLLSVSDPTAAERRDAERLARAIFLPEGDEVVHRYEGQVAVISWAGSAR